MTHRPPFAELLQHYRAVAGLTQEGLAERAGVSVRAISDLERGVKLAPRAETLRLLADALALNPAERAAFGVAARQAGARRVGGSREAATPAAAPEPPALDRLPIVGRARECQQLAGLVDEAAAGRGRLVLIAGEPGIGKSRLVLEALAEARRRGHRTLLTGCYQVEQTMPYHPVIDLVGQALDAWPAALATLPAPVLADLARLVPTVPTPYPATAALPSEAPEARQSRLVQALLHLVDAVATPAHPLVLAVDDLHWADTASLACLHHLARHVRSRPLLVLFAYRDEEVAAEARLATAVQHLRREAGTVHLPLRRLAPDDTGALLVALADPALPAPALGPWLQRETDGNPFFLVSILHSLLEGGVLPTHGPAAWQVDPAGLTAAGPALTVPEALRAAVRLRLRRLPAPARALLDVAAVLGRRFDVATLQAVTGEPEASLLDQIDELVHRRLLHDEGDGSHLDFSHDKIREVVYHDLASPRRVASHRRVAAALAVAPAGTAGPAAALADHYERGQLWPQAIAGLAAAGDAARRLFATREALAFYDRAIDLALAHAGPDPAADAELRLSLTARRGETRAQAGEFAGAIDDSQRVLAAVRRRGDATHERERELLITLGMIYRRIDAYAEARRCLDAALAVARAAADPHSVADTLYHLGTVAWGAGDNHQALACHEEAVATCEALGLADYVTAQAYHGRGEARAFAGRPELAIADYTAALELARRLGDRAGEAENLQMLGWAYLGLFGLGDYARATDRLAESLAICRAHHLDWHVPATLIALAHAAAATGDYRRGLDHAEQARLAADAVGATRFVTFALDAEGDIWRDLGDLARAEAAHRRGLALAGHSDGAFWLPRLQANLVIDRLRSGDPAAADDLADALAAARAGNLVAHLGRCLEAAAEAALARGDPDGALDAAAELAELAEPSHLREWLAQAHRWRGAALLASGQPAPAEAALRRALVLAEAVGRARLMHDLHTMLAQIAARR